MAVRQFDGTDDDIQRAIGALTGMTHGTVVTLLKRTALAGFDAIYVPHTSGGTRRLQVSFNNSNTNWYPGTGPTDSQGPAVDNTTDWWLIFARKPTGTATPRFSVLNQTTGVWTHGDGTNALPDSATPGAGGTVRFTVQGGEHVAALLAAQAAWSNALPWSADAAGDAAIEAAGLETAYQNWIDAAPDAAWRFNQASISTPVPDDTGNGADQTAITGTTVVTGDDPPFNFTLLQAFAGTTDIASEAEGSVQVTRALSGQGDQAGNAQGSLTINRFLTGSADTASDATGSLSVFRSISGVADMVSDASGTLSTGVDFIPELTGTVTVRGLSGTVRSDTLSGEATVLGLAGSGMLR